MAAELVNEDVVVLAEDHRITLPENVREYLDLQPGQKARWVLYDGTYRLIRVTTLHESRGSLKGIDTSVPR